MRIAQVSTLLERVPPERYGGVERIAAFLCDELVAAGHDPALVERVIQLVDNAEYKRRQYPPGPKISAKNFGRDRRLPITSRWREPRCG